MNKLRNVAETPDVLSDALKENAINHKNYKLYTSITLAMDILLSGTISLSDGQYWNDVIDREQMKGRTAFGKCFSCSTRENIDMWMLYGGQFGQNGAMLNFTKKMINSILKSDVSYGIHRSDGRFEEIRTLKKDEYNIFLTDVLYTDECADEMVILTYYDEHMTVLKDSLNHKDIFTKNYAWSYEKECRLIVEPCCEVLSEMQEMKHKENGKEEWISILLHIPNASLRELKKSRLFQSPVYSSQIYSAIPSELTGKVSWKPQ